MPNEERERLRSLIKQAEEHKRGTIDFDLLETLDIKIAQLREELANLGWSRQTRKKWQDFRKEHERRRQERAHYRVDRIAENQRRRHERFQENERQYEEWQRDAQARKQEQKVAVAAQRSRGRYYPASAYKGSAVHLMYSTSPRIPVFTFTFALCGKRVINSLPGTAGDATCSVCRLKAGVGRR